MRAIHVAITCQLAAQLLTACSSGDSTDVMTTGPTGVFVDPTLAGTTSGTTGATIVTTGTSPDQTGSTTTGVSGTTGLGPPTTGQPTTTGGTTGTSAGATTATAPDAGGAGEAGATPVGLAGPEEGDPNAPIVSVPEVACGGSSGGFGASTNFELGGRGMIVTYPCNKHAGAPMTFFLNLHGTTPVNLHFYQHGYFAAHQFAESHNLIVVTPSSVVEQWGNGDGGADEPHLMEIIDWVYEAFDGEGKFDIRSMWVGGHSWGAFYTSTFACKPYLADKVKGAVLMSGSNRNPACAEKISVIGTVAEDDIGPIVEQGTVPMSHGCGAAQITMVGNNEETLWPDCDPGFAHANYLMFGKGHTDSIDREVVERIVDQIKAARP